MVIDIPDERGLANIDLRFGDPLRCHFPLFNWLSPLPLEYMGLLYFIMWLGKKIFLYSNHLLLVHFINNLFTNFILLSGSLGICLGFKFKISCFMFTIPYWYIYLLDKSFWNNHSYLFGLISILFAFTCANYSLWVLKF